MKSVNTTEYLEKVFGIEKTIHLLADAGFDGVDYSDIGEKSFSSEYGFEMKAAEIRKLAESRGLKFYQTHAPITTSLLRQGDMKYAKERIKRSLCLASVLGAEVAVVHPFQHESFLENPEYVYETNMEFFSCLMKFAKEYGVKIAIENMIMTDLTCGHKTDGVCANPLEFKRYIDSLNSEYVTGCLDLGHALLSGREPQDVIRTLGSKYITCLHVHDNDGIHDNHALPCTMNMNWDEICKALADIGYNGNFTLEAICFLSKYTEDFVPTALTFMNDTSRYLIVKTENFKSLIK